MVMGMEIAVMTTMVMALVLGLGYLSAVVAEAVGGNSRVYVLPLQVAMGSLLGTEMAMLLLRLRLVTREDNIGGLKQRW
jgi:hypothetical protein